MGIMPFVHKGDYLKHPVAVQYFLSLSLAELYWLGGLFGEMSLPLPGQWWADMGMKNSQELVEEGQASLLSKGLIRRREIGGWVVDSLISLIVKWLASADQFLIIGSYQNSGDQIQSFIYPSGNEVMAIKPTGSIFDVIIFQNLDAFLSDLLDQFFSKREYQASAAEYPISQPKELIPAVWKNGERAANMLGAVGIEGKEAERVAAWIKNLISLLSLQRIYRDGNHWKIDGENHICTDGRCIWANLDLKNREAIKFESASFDEIQKVLLQVVHL